MLYKKLFSVILIIYISLMMCDSTSLSFNDTFDIVDIEGKTSVSLISDANLENTIASISTGESSDNKPSEINNFFESAWGIILIIGSNIALMIIVLIVIVACLKNCCKGENPQSQGYEMKTLKDNEEEFLEMPNLSSNSPTDNTTGTVNELVSEHPDIIPSSFFKGSSDNPVREVSFLEANMDEVSSMPRSRVRVYFKDEVQPLTLRQTSVVSSERISDIWESDEEATDLSPEQIRKTTCMETSYIRRSAVIIKRRTTNSQLLREADEFQALCEYYEFPVENLEFGEDLGMGAFGIVRHAYAHGLVYGEEKTPVAVKSIKGEHKHEKQALMSEIRIMVHIGQHKNVVNLLGIISQDVPKYEFMIMVEYCSFGNIRDFLKNYKYEFIDDVDPITGTINCNIRQSSLKTHSLLSTAHLLCWSFQVARGMEFLSSKRVIHGDLAARNILLCEDNFVKICDFGLARFKRESNYYMKRGSGLLPVKWIALECFKENIFSTYSDVWSFGVVLWEFFSLGEEPYKEIDLTKIFGLLSSGNRMMKPKYSTDELYKIMKRCWAEDPKERSLFSELENTLGQMMDTTEKNFVVSSNEPYISMNKKVEDHQRILNNFNLEKIRINYQNNS